MFTENNQQFNNNYLGIYTNHLTFHGGDEDQLEVMSSSCYYGKKNKAETINYLETYSKTPQRPIFPHEVSTTILNEVIPKSNEFNLISLLLSNIFVNCDEI